MSVRASGPSCQPLTPTPGLEMNVQVHRDAPNVPKRQTQSLMSRENILPSGPNRKCLFIKLQIRPFKQKCKVRHQDVRFVRSAVAMEGNYGDDAPPPSIVTHNEYFVVAFRNLVG